MGTIQITDGVLGSKELLESKDELHNRDYFVKTDNVTGFGILRVKDKLHLHFAHVNNTGGVVDSFDLYKTNAHVFAARANFAIRYGAEIFAVFLILSLILLVVLLFICLRGDERSKWNKVVEMSPYRPTQDTQL
eukprot:TRINITY_DN3261_c0_g1_i3.p1 TRINITY_DN3261_c0_g1~~TRINITY_DN3261_c0_g1_i3.p1  ORF type:complete len:134 (+),score=20.11 TRINITY_DN3261_c0_g1_i3:94-495(+)